MQFILGFIAILTYGLSTYFILRMLNAMRCYDSPLARPGYFLPIWGVALTAHGLLVLVWLLNDDSLRLSFYHAISAVFWLVSSWLLVATRQKPVEIIGVLVLPLAGLSLPLALFMPDSYIPETESNPYLSIHIFISLLSYSLLTLASLQAVLLSLQNKHIHNHHPTGIICLLPPLRHMENLLFQMIQLGFGLLSLALLTGFLFLEDIFAQHQVHKTVLSIVAWIVFGSLLLGHSLYGWRGKTAVRWTLGGFSVLLLAYFGSKLVLEVILS